MSIEPDVRPVVVLSLFDGVCCVCGDVYRKDQRIVRLETAAYRHEVCPS